MYTAEQVAAKIAEWEAQGMQKALIAWEAAKACIGWPYIFGAAGQECTIAYRRQVAGRGTEAKYQNVRKACQAIREQNPTGSCSGCKWYPGGKRVRSFDCRGFTRRILQQTYGWTLQGSGCTSQWNNAENWRAKGKISDGFPENVLVCLFYSKDGKEVTWEHTGFGLNNETVECSAGVQFNAKRDKKWTHWAVPKCVEGEIIPVPVPVTKPTLRRGSKGEYVTLLQTKLVQLGYDIGSAGVDGVYGRGTEAAVKAFQKDHGLAQDGICGPKTWEAIDAAQPETGLYTVHIPHLTKYKAEALIGQYSGAWMTKEDA